jgi:hypothetical protein
MLGYPSDAEVVQSILSETKLQPTFWCRVRLHRWTRWEVVHKGVSTEYNGFNNVKYEDVRRECLCCGFPQKKVVWTQVK